MARKYFIRQVSPEGDIYTVVIDDPNYTGSITEIEGDFDYGYALNTDVLENIIVGSYLNLKLYANKTKNFRDLITDSDREISVSLWVGQMAQAVKLFDGWLSSEGWFEDFVNAEWEINLHAEDGLGFVQNFMFTDDNGLELIDKLPITTALAYALKKSGKRHNIYIDVRFYYDGMPTPNCVFEKTWIDLNNFKDEDGTTIKSAEDAIRSLLLPFGAIVSFQSFGTNFGWFIYRPRDLGRVGDMAFYKYDPDGKPAYDPKDPILPLNRDILIGSHLEGYYPHHAGANQKLTLRKPPGVLEYKYEYLYNLSIFRNPQFVWDYCSDLKEWNVVDNTYPIEPLENCRGIRMNTRSWDSQKFFLQSWRSPDILDNFDFKLILNFGFERVYYQNMAFRLEYDIRIRVEFVRASDNQVFYLRDDGRWTNRKTYISIDSGGLSPRATGYEFEYILEVGAPYDGYMYIGLESPDLNVYNTIGQHLNGEVIAYWTRFSFTITKHSLPKGEIHTVRKIDNPNAKNEELREVYFGDNDSEYVTGNFYKENGEDPTDLWSRNRDDARYLPILAHAIIEDIALRSKTMQIYSGDIYGFVPMMARVRFTDLAGAHIPIAWSFYPAENKGSIVLLEINPLDPVGYSYNEYQYYDDEGHKDPLV